MMSRFFVGLLVCAVACISLSYRRSATTARDSRTRLLEVSSDTSPLEGRSLIAQDAAATQEGGNQIEGYRPHDRELLGGNKLRVATFGSAVTWGLGVPNRYFSYPYLLSSTADNFAFFSAGPNYPAVCTQTMVGDDAIYDVIVLEYRMRATQGLLELAERLRARFPQAQIFFLLLETTRDIRRREVDSTTNQLRIETLDQWHQRLNPNLPWKLLKNELHEDTAGDWMYPPRPNIDNVIYNVTEKVNGEIIRFPIDPTHQKGFLVHHWEFYNEHHQLTLEGHAWLAGEILNRTQTVDGDASSAVEGVWNENDSCHLWFTTGDCNFEYESSALEMVEYDTYRGKYALEVHGVGWIKPINPHDVERELFLSFLATATGVYPETKISWVSSDGRTNGTTIDPVTTHDSHGAHVVRTVSLGMMSSGITTVWFEPIETGAKLPFRLVGASFVGSVPPMEYDFAPVFNA